MPKLITIGNMVAPLSTKPLGAKNDSQILKASYQGFITPQTRYRAKNAMPSSVV
jgi:hypothetical protein